MVEFRAMWDSLNNMPYCAKHQDPMNARWEHISAEATQFLKQIDFLSLCRSRCDEGRENIVTAQQGSIGVVFT